jgi:hypothetical protein
VSLSALGNVIKALVDGNA